MRTDLTQQTSEIYPQRIEDITVQETKTSPPDLQKRRSEVKNSQIFEMMERITDGFYALDEEWRIIYANNQAAKILNVKREDYMGRILWECFPRLIGSNYEEQYHKAVKEKMPVYFTSYVETYDSWYELHVYPSDTGLSVFFRDISERIRAETERRELDTKIKQQQEQLVNILERMNQGFFSLDKDYRVTYWNKKAEEYFGVSREEILGRSILRLYNKEALDHYLPLLQKVQEEQKPFEGENLCPQNNKWTDLNIYPSEEGGFTVFFKYIDDRKRNEEELQKLSTIAQQTNNIAIITDTEGRVTWVNDAFTRVSGYTLSEALGLIPGEFLRGPESDPHVTAQIDAKIAKAEPFTVETKNYTKNKEMYWVEMHCQPVHDKNGKIVQFFSLQTDITARKNLEAKLQAQQKRINAAVFAAQEKERAQVGQELHDNVNQVLTTVKLYTELCRDGIGNTQEIQKKSIKLLQESINEIRSLSKRLSAPSLGNIKLKDSVKELVDAVADTGKVALLLDTSGLEDLEIDHELHLGIYRILQEHFTNILKHAAAKEAHIQIHVINGELVLQVNDDGKGFDTKQKRSGIGIANMTTRAESLKGVLTINSAPGAGCQLIVHLPLK
jgi:PAS domain S-box-containing protein